MSTDILNIILSIVVTIVCYTLAFKINRAYKKSWLNPLYTASILLIIILLIFHIPIETYQSASFIFNHLLQLAVIALAVPLFRQWELLMRNYKKILVGVLSGTLSGVTAVVIMAHLFHINEQLQASLIPRSVTLPIALTVATELGGLTSMTIAFVIVSALISVTLGPYLLKNIGIKSKSAKGLAMGTSAQMLGASRCLTWGEEEGAMGNIAMTTSALFLVIILPFVPFLI